MTRAVTNLALSCVAVGAALALLRAAPAEAAGMNWVQTFVSNTGSDANPCNEPAVACGSIARALSQTAVGGEVTVLTAGLYGLTGIVINQSVYISNDGAGEATLKTFDVPFVGITINAGAGAVVGLRGLAIDGFFSGPQGIHIDQASAVHIQNCVIRNFEDPGSGYGIALPPVGSTQLFVSDTLIYNNGSSAGTGGIYVGPTDTGSANVVLDRVHLENNVVGLLVDGFHGNPTGAHVVIRDSVVSGNASHGIQARSAPTGAPAFLVVERTAVVNNAGTGILAGGPHATMLLDGNVVARNGVGISAASSGQLITYGNNRVNNNLGADGAPTGSYSPI